MLIVYLLACLLVYFLYILETQYTLFHSVHTYFGGAKYRKISRSKTQKTNPDKLLLKPLRHAASAWQGSKGADGLIPYTYINIYT